MAKLEIVRSVARLQEIMAMHCNGPLSTIASEVPKVRSELLTAEQSKVLSDYVVEHTLDCYIDFNVDGMIEEYFGLKEAGPLDIVFTTISGKAMTAIRNRRNRRKTLSRCRPASTVGTYSNIMVRGLWVTLPTDPFAMDWDGIVQSAQHRGDAMLDAKNNGATLPLVRATFGIPPQLRDWMDKTKQRTLKDDNDVDDTILPLDKITEVQLNVSGVSSEPNALPDVRRKLLDLRSKVISSVLNRASGKNIPTTGGKREYVEEYDFVQSCDFDFDSFLVEVLEHARTQSGKIDAQWTSFFAPSIVATGIILHSCGEDWVQRQVATLERDDNETVEQFAERRMLYKATILRDSQWTLSSDYSQILKNLATSIPGAGVYGDVFQMLADSIKSEKKGNEAKKYLYSPLSIASMSAFVQLLKNADTGSLSGKDASVWTVYRANKDGDYSPEYRCFGGKDVGYIAPKRGKSKD